MIIEFQTLKAACRYVGKGCFCSKPPNFAGNCAEENCPLKDNRGESKIQADLGNHTRELYKYRDLCNELTAALNNVERRNGELAIENAKLKKQLTEIVTYKSEE